MYRGIAGNTTAVDMKGPEEIGWRNGDEKGKGRVHTYKDGPRIKIEMTATKPDMQGR